MGRDPGGTLLVRLCVFLLTVLQLVDVGHGRIRRNTGHVYRSHGHYPLVRHGDPDVIAEREVESEGRFGAEQAVVLPFNQEPVLFELHADRGQRAAALAEHSLYHPYSQESEHKAALASNTNHFPLPSPAVLMEMQMAQAQAASAASVVPPTIAFQAVASLPPPPALSYGMDLVEDDEVPPPPSFSRPAVPAVPAMAASADTDLPAPPLVLLEQDMTIQSRSSMPPGLPSDMPPGFLTVEQRMAQYGEMNHLQHPAPGDGPHMFPTPLGIGPSTPAMAMAANFAPRFVVQHQQQQQDQQNNLQEQLRQHHTMQLMRARANVHLSLPPQRDMPPTGRVYQQASGLPSSVPPAPRFATMMRGGSAFGNSAQYGSAMGFSPLFQQHQQAQQQQQQQQQQMAMRGGPPEDAYYDSSMMNHLVQPQNQASNTLPGPPRLPDLPPPPVGIY